MFKLGQYFQNLGFTEIKVFLNLGLKSFVVFKIPTNSFGRCFQSSVGYNKKQVLVTYNILGGWVPYILF